MSNGKFKHEFVRKYSWTHLATLAVINMIKLTSFCHFFHPNDETAVVVNVTCVYEVLELVIWTNGLTSFLNVTKKKKKNKKKKQKKKTNFSLDIGYEVL